MKVTRRDFFVTTAVGAAGAAALGAETTPAAVSPEASARWYWIVNKWGMAFTQEQEADIKRLLSDNVKGLETMRAYLLTNDVVPSVVEAPMTAPDVAEATSLQVHSPQRGAGNGPSTALGAVKR